MITNADVFNALKTLQMFCYDHDNCRDCPLGLSDEDSCECMFCNMIDASHYLTDSYYPSSWNVESLRPSLDPASAASDH